MTRPPRQNHNARAAEPRAKKLWALCCLVLGVLAGTPEVHATIDNTARATGSFNGNTIQSDPDSVNITVGAQTASLSVVKQADDLTDVVAGQVITYTYIVTNNGTQSLTNVTLADTHNGIPGSLVPVFQSFTINTGSTHSGNTITLFLPGDVAEFQATYTVTQFDVDNRQ